MIDTEQPAKWKMVAMLDRCLEEKKAMMATLEKEIKKLKDDIKEYDDWVVKTYSKGNVYTKKEKV